MVDELRHTITMSNLSDPDIVVATTISMQGSPARSDQAEKQKQWADQMRGWLAAIAALVAQSSLQAGLSPPGGFWQDDNNGHVAGNPVLADRYKVRYHFFFYLNAVSFATSLAVVIMVSRQNVHSDSWRLIALRACVGVGLVVLTGVYAAGARRDMPSTYFVVALVGLMFLEISSILSLAPVCVRWAWKCLKKTLFGPEDDMRSTPGPAV